MSNGFLTADSFVADWYGYLTNQCAHITWGQACVVGWCLVAFLIQGEFPQKEVMFFGIMSTYVFFEIYQGGRDWADSLEDTIYVSIWGAGLLLLACDWVEGSKFDGDVMRLYPWVLFLATQMFLGCWFRYRLAKQLRALSD